MGLITKEVPMGLTGGAIKYYEGKGYAIPRHIDVHGKMTVPRGTRIMVNVNDIHRKSHAKVSFECDKCGKIVTIPWAGYLKHKKDLGVYCSLCAPSVYTSGENNTRWNHLLTKEDREVARSTPEYKDMIARVKKRDNYTCYLCGTVCHDIEVHHLNSYTDFPSMRLEQSNCVCLCHAHHRQYHSIYGRDHSRKEYFEAWVKHPMETIKDYDGEIPQARSIYCIDDDLVFEDALEAASYYNADRNAFYNVCGRKSNLRSIRGKHFLYYDEYTKMNSSDILEFWKWVDAKSLNHRLVIRLNDGKVFASVADASRDSGISIYYVSICCKGKIKSATNKNDVELMFAYYTDYLERTIKSNQ